MSDLEVDLGQLLESIHDWAFSNRAEIFSIKLELLEGTFKQLKDSYDKGLLHLPPARHENLTKRPSVREYKYAEQVKKNA